ncbi:MAG: SurA N-terminal domain-containing protein [Pseudomonadota bacterium]
MISFFRRIFQSKIGLAFTFAFIALIALSFAAMDVTGTTFGGVAGNDRVARVGDERISTSTLTQSTNSALRNIREDQPTMTMEMLIEEGGLDEVLDQLIDRFALGAYAKEYGLRVGTNLLNSELLQIPAFRGPSGNFDQDQYLEALRRQGLTDATFKEDLANGLLAQQLLVPALGSLQVPDKIALRYAELLNERRTGVVSLIPSTAFLPEGDPTDAQLTEFYNENRSRYLVPERRTIRFSAFDSGNITDRIEPTDAEIAARFERDVEQYAAQESRTISVFFAPTEDAATAIRDRVAGGASLDAVAAEAGFSVSQTDSLTQDQMGSTISSAVAEAVFAAERGSIATPARSDVGWAIARVDAIDRRAAQSLADVTPAISEQLQTEKRAAALADLSARIEEQIDDGQSINEVAGEFDLEVETTPQLLADGRVFGNSGATVNEALRGVLETAFQMDEGEPQLAEIVRGTQFIIFEVAEVTESAAPPLDEIRQQVAITWSLAEGDKRAQEASQRILDGVRNGGSIAQAIQAEGATIPAGQSVDLDRRELFEQYGQRTPPALALLFSMAEGTTKRLEAPNDLRN